MTKITVIRELNGILVNLTEIGRNKSWIVSMWLFNFIMVIIGHYKDATKVRGDCHRVRADWLTVRADWLTVRADWLTVRADWLTVRADWLTTQIVVITSTVHLTSNNNEGDRVSRVDGERLKLIVHFICESILFILGVV